MMTINEIKTETARLLNIEPELIERGNRIRSWGRINDAVKLIMAAAVFAGHPTGTIGKALKRDRTSVYHMTKNLPYDLDTPLLHLKLAILQRRKQEMLSHLEQLNTEIQTIQKALS